MYNHFFGFQERPFKLVPNPAYLYLSKSHEEALAHLQYAVTDGEGFVEITGDVGTGKTLLCRTFLENLGPEVESAYIFNPRLDALDLLKAINDEFGVASSFDSKKALMDALNAFLMRKKGEGRRVILLIDEAQNLSMDVLEQIRLLSNLETTQEKLLQIILVGQPELSEMLDAYELRQLGQRISLSCRLRALDMAETRKYINHRLQVAAQKPADIFTSAAIRRIYRFSRGVPRLINIGCDRALLTAFAHHRRRVTGGLARIALMELAARGDIHRAALGEHRKPALVLAVLCLALAGILIYQSTENRLRPLVEIPPSAPKQATVSPAPPPAVSSPTPPTPVNPLPQTKPERPAPPPAFLAFQPFLAADQGLSRGDALTHVLNAWGFSSPDPESPASGMPEEVMGLPDEGMFFNLAARSHGFVVTPVNGDIALIVNLNLPAVLALRQPETGEGRYGVVVSASSTELTFAASGDQRAKAAYGEVMNAWTGEAWVFWKDFYNYKGVVAHSASPDAVLALKLHLRDIGCEGLSMDGAFDGATQAAIREIQARHGIPTDGVVGSLTKMVMYNETPSLTIPHLWPMTASENTESAPDGRPPWVPAPGDGPSATR